MLFPSEKQSEVIQGVETTLIDAAMPVMLVRASDVGKTAYETAQELTQDTIFLARVEAMRREAGERMGLGDVSNKVVPKIIIAAAPKGDGNITSRYFVPDKAHETHAITGGIALAHACQIPVPLFMILQSL